MDTETTTPVIHTSAAVGIIASGGIAMTGRERTCRQCGERKPIGAFQARAGVVGTGRDSHLRTCMSCIRGRVERPELLATTAAGSYGAGVWDAPVDGATPRTVSEWKARLMAGSDDE